MWDSCHSYFYTGNLIQNVNNRDSKIWVLVQKDSFGTHLGHRLLRKKLTQNNPSLIAFLT